MPSTRSQSLSQSQLISHASLLPSYPIESFASTSTATLPPLYRISLAVASSDLPLGLVDQRKHYVRGEEFLSDAWRRDGGTEGRLDERRNQLKRKREEFRPVLQAGAEHEVVDSSVKADTLWYTAGLRYPCICMSVWPLTHTGLQTQASSQPTHTPSHPPTLPRPGVTSPHSHLTLIRLRFLGSEISLSLGPRQPLRSTLILPSTSLRSSRLHGPLPMAPCGGRRENRPHAMIYRSFSTSLAEKRGGRMESPELPSSQWKRGGGVKAKVEKYLVP